MNLPNSSILYEDTHILVCKKPAGIAVQSARLGSPDMVSIIKNYLYKNNISRDTGYVVAKNSHTDAWNTEPYLAVIHRLDQPVEGVLVFAKTPFAAKELNKEMQSGGFGKHYHALVNGKPPKDCDTIEDYMTKDGRTNTSRICSKDTKGAKLARLSYQIISDTSSAKNESSTNHSDQETTLLDITLDTGRHHQIRVQMAHMGCPIVGDQKYGNVESDSASNNSAQRVQNTHTPRRPKTKLELCAYKLEFHHPKTKKAMTFTFQESI